MVPSLEVAVSLLTAAGIGSILGAFFQSRFEQQKQIKEKEHELKRRRYSAILMLTKLDPKTGVPHIREIRPDLKDSKDIEKEIEVELLNGVLFASDAVIKSMAGFVRNPTYSSYIETAVAMRKDLWGSKTSVDEQILNVLKKEEPRPT